MKIAKEMKENMATTDWQEISRLRMEFAAKNPEIVEKMLLGDPSAIEALTNFGGINAKVTLKNS
jgi:hypothetical protein